MVGGGFLDLRGFEHPDPPPPHRCRRTRAGPDPPQQHLRCVPPTAYYFSGTGKLDDGFLGPRLRPWNREDLLNNHSGHHDHLLVRPAPSAGQLPTVLPEIVDGVPAGQHQGRRRQRPDGLDLRLRAGGGGGGHRGPRGNVPLLLHSPPWQRRLHEGVLLRAGRILVQARVVQRAGPEDGGNGPHRISLSVEHNVPPDHRPRRRVDRGYCRRGPPQDAEALRGPAWRWAAAVGVTAPATPG